MNILIAGGAGYIGSHCSYLLEEKGYQVIVLDNLSTGHKEALSPSATFIEGDIGDQLLTTSIFKEYEIDAVMHFAAFALVGESVKDPIKYYKNNVSATCNLLEAMLKSNVKNFIFSSSCATYGSPDGLPIRESTPQKPINPYGETKLYVENLLKSLSISHDLKSVSFRYFNASGAMPREGHQKLPLLGENHIPESHLIPCILLAALAKKAVMIYGDDYPTPDGTCLRDYVHVNDISSAHILAIDYLLSQKEAEAHFFNLGLGRPYSVKEVIAACEKVIGAPIASEIHPRRAGDPAALYADATLAHQVLGWEPIYQDLEKIIQTAWYWHKSQA